MQAHRGFVDNLIDFLLGQTSDRFIQNRHQHRIQLGAGRKTGLQGWKFQRIIIPQI